MPASGPHPSDSLSAPGQPTDPVDSRVITRKRGRAVSLVGETIVKQQDPVGSRRERLRTAAGRAVGEQTGLFAIPALLSFDDARGEMVFERIRAPRLRQALADPDRSVELLSRVGLALAAVHGRMSVDDAAGSPGTGGVEKGPGRLVPCHGDFGINNLFYLPDSDRIAIIDWSNADWVGIDGDLAEPEVDVAVLLLSLFERRAFGPSPVARRREAARQFLATYVSASPYGLDLAALRRQVRALTPAFAQLSRERRGFLRALARRHSVTDLHLFLRRLAREGFLVRAGAPEADTMESPRTSLRYTDRHKGRGQDYAETFSPEVNPYRAMVWRLEQRVLGRILRDYLKSGSIAHLDFACGTGRILGFFREHVASATGVDVSASMMEVARQAAPEAELLEADLTQHDVLGERTFDLITAFRFFPNAEPDLRRAVFRALARHLAPHGILVFNNHKNRNSLRRRISRLMGREVARGTMTHEEVAELAADAGVRILEVIPLATLPISDKRLLLPVSLAEFLERRLSGHPKLAGVAQDLIYVCGRR